MLVRNENFQETELSQIVNEILNDYKQNPNVNISEEEAKRALAQMVYEGSLISNRFNLKSNNYAMPIAEAEYAKIPVINWIWEKLQEKICPKFDEETKQEKIADIIAEAIAELIPFGIIVKRLLKIVLFFVLKYGHTIVCTTENDVNE